MANDLASVVELCSQKQLLVELQSRCTAKACKAPGVLCYDVGRKWGVVGLRRPGAGICINMIGPQTVVQMVEKLDETMIEAQP